MAPARAGTALWDALGHPTGTQSQSWPRPRQLAPGRSGGTCRVDFAPPQRYRSPAAPAELSRRAAPCLSASRETCPSRGHGAPCRGWGRAGHQTAPAKESEAPPPATPKSGQRVQRAPLGSPGLARRRCSTRARGCSAENVSPPVRERACASPHRQLPAFYAFLRRTRLVGHSSAGGFSPAELLCCQTHPGWRLPAPWR